MILQRALDGRGTAAPACLSEARGHVKHALHIQSFLTEPLIKWIVQVLAKLISLPCPPEQAGGAGVKSDPIITGFDGKSFHFDQTGEFTLLSSGDGFRVSPACERAAGVDRLGVVATSWGLGTICPFPHRFKLITRSCTGHVDWAAAGAAPLPH